MPSLRPTSRCARCDVDASLGGDDLHERVEPRLAVERRRRFDDLVAELGEQRRGRLDAGDAIGMDRIGEHRRDGEGDAQPAGRRADLVEIGSRRRLDFVRRADVGALDGVEQGRAIADGTRQRVADREAAPRFALDAGRSACARASA